MVSEIIESIELIPDEDKVSRACFELPPEIDPESQFAFCYDKVRRECAESVTWRRYAPAIMDVHTRGCNVEELKSKRPGNAGKVRNKYIGSRTALVEGIRAIKSGRGHGFNVVHFPENNDNAHSHVCVQSNGDQPVKKLKANDMRELSRLLFEYFGVLEPHSCDT